jgi:hypothetical protein
MSIVHSVITLGALKVLVISADGLFLGSEAGALDLISAAYGQDVDLIAVPTSRLGETFFELSTGIAGAFIQKIRNYRYRLAIVGDISRHTNASKSLRDFVFESNKGKDVLFVPDLDAIAARL